MAAAACDTVSAVRHWRAAGAVEAQAEVIVQVMSHSQGDPITKADRKPRHTDRDRSQCHEARRQLLP